MAYTKYKNISPIKVYFGSDDSYTKYGLVPTKYDIGIPNRKLIEIDTILTQGKVDVTDSVISTPTFENAIVRMTFEVLEGRKNFALIRAGIMNSIHGKYMSINIVDPMTGTDSTFTGRMKLNMFKSNKSTGTIVIDADVNPVCAKGFVVATLGFTLQKGNDYIYICSTNENYVSGKTDVYVRLITDGQLSAKKTASSTEDGTVLTKQWTKILSKTDGSYLYLENTSGALQRSEVEIKYVIENLIM